jgi:hypothetical protein
MGTGVELFPINQMFCIQVGSRDIVVLKHILFLKHFKDVDDYFITPAHDHDHALNSSVDDGSSYKLLYTTKQSYFFFFMK